MQVTTAAAQGCCEGCQEQDWQVMGVQMPRQGAHVYRDVSQQVPEDNSAGYTAAEALP